MSVQYYIAYSTYLRILLLLLLVIFVYDKSFWLLSTRCRYSSCSCN